MHYEMEVVPPYDVWCCNCRFFDEDHLAMTDDDYPQESKN